MIRDAQLAEKENLRQELLSLKDCQVRYFAITITFAAAILGIGSQLGKTTDIILLSLAPLVITLPCWWIFFDKATTITRIVAYMRILEEAILDPTEGERVYVGWERSLSLFRYAQRQMTPLERNRQFWSGLRIGVSRGLLFRTTSRYWVINWYTFVGISLFCVLLSHSRAGGSGLWMTFFVLFGASAIFNLSVLGNLIDGSYSYDFNEAYWRDLLKVQAESQPARKENDTHRSGPA